MRIVQPILVVPVLLTLPYLCAGCTSGTHTARLARFEPGVTTSLAAAPETGVYTTKWIGRGPGEPIHVTQRIVREGDPLGFTRADDGTVVAIAGDERIELAGIPTETGRLVWHTRRQHEGSGGPDADDVLRGAANLAVGAAIVGGVLGLAFLGLDTDHDRHCDGDDDDSYRLRHGGLSRQDRRNLEHRRRD